MPHVAKVWLLWSSSEYQHQAKDADRATGLKQTDLKMWLREPIVGTGLAHLTYVSYLRHRPASEACV